MKFLQKIKAISLRQKGFSYPQINKYVNVSRGTLSRWLRDIELTATQKGKLLDGKEKGRLMGAKTQQLKRLRVTKELLNTGKTEFYELYKNPLFLSGLLLYWAEGDKHQAESIKFTNADPSMIALMMRWFREICRVPEEKFRIGLHIHSLHIREDIKKYWSQITGIPENQFHKIYVKRTSLRQRKHILYNGTCTIRINNKNLFRKIMGWRTGLLNYFHISS